MSKGVLENSTENVMRIRETTIETEDKGNIAVIPLALQICTSRLYRLTLLYRAPFSPPPAALRLHIGRAVYELPDIS